MNTLLLRDDRPGDVAMAGALLREGKLVVIPTETVYGLAANALDPQAIQHIFVAKGRPADNPLIVHISAKSQMDQLVQSVPQAALALAEAFWPGPLTMILKKSDLVPPEVSGGLDTVAIRLPGHPTARAVIDQAGVPLAAPSANLSGRPSPTSFAHVQEDMIGRVDAIVNGGDCKVGVESTVISLARDTPRVLRPGGITLSQLRQVLGEVEVDPAVTGEPEAAEPVSSPGMKYRHYAPKAPVVLVQASPEEFAAYVNAIPQASALCFEETLPLLAVPALCYGGRYDRAQQARLLFARLHQVDAQAKGTVYAQIPSKVGVGLAVFNRLIRAASFQVVRPTPCPVIGLTGLSGSGKTTVAQLLAKRGLGVLDCDAETKSPGVYDGDCLAELATAFGQEIIGEGQLNRRLLATKAFASVEGAAALNAITHPRILRHLRRRIQEERGTGIPALVLDAPTLFEAGLDQACGFLVVVTAPTALRLERILQRDGITRGEALARFAAQKDPAFYTEKADVVFHCETGVPDPFQLENLYQEIQHFASDTQGETTYL